MQFPILIRSFMPRNSAIQNTSWPGMFDDDNCNSFQCPPRCSCPLLHASLLRRIQTRSPPRSVHLPPLRQGCARAPQALRHVSEVPDHPFRSEGGLLGGRYIREAARYLRPQHDRLLRDDGPSSYAEGLPPPWHQLGLWCRWRRPTRNGLLVQEDVPRCGVS